MRVAPDKQHRPTPLRGTAELVFRAVSSLRKLCGISVSGKTWGRGRGYAEEPRIRRRMQLFLKTTLGLAIILTAIPSNAKGPPKRRAFAFSGGATGPTAPW